MPPKRRDTGSHEKLRVIPVMTVTEDLPLFLFEKLSELALDDSSKPITLVIHSPGGSMFDALASADTIAFIKGLLDPDVPIIGVVHGYAFSAGSYLLQCCDHRVITDHGYLMVHGVTQGFFQGDERTADRNRTLIRSLRHTVAEAYISRSAPTIRGIGAHDFWNRIARDNTPLFLTAQEALDYGLVDEIVETSVGARFGRDLGESQSQASDEAEDEVFGVQVQSGLGQSRLPTLPGLPGSGGYTWPAESTVYNDSAPTKTY